MSRLFDIGEAIELHCDQVNRYGGTSGVRHTGALRAAVGQKDHAADPFALAAGYCLDFVAMRPFPDGNARVGMLAALVSLDLNGISCDLADDAIVEMVEKLRGRSVGAKELANFLRAGAGRPVSRQTVALPKPAETPAAPATEKSPAKPADPAPDHPAAESAAVTEAAAAAAAEIADTPPPPEPSPGAHASLDAPAGPGVDAVPDRPTSVRDLADALAEFRDDDESSAE